MNILHIGCTDCNDDAYKYVKEHSDEIESLIVIDANPKCIEIAKEKYSFIKNLFAINVAISNDAGITSLFIPDDDDIHPHASLLPDIVKAHGHKKLKRITVPKIPLHTVFNSFPFKINRLYIDIEGFDVPAILDLDLKKYSPEFIQYEFLHSDGAFAGGYGNSQQQLVKYLRGNGYTVKQYGEFDAIAQKQNG